MEMDPRFGWYLKQQDNNPTLVCFPSYIYVGLLYGSNFVAKVPSQSCLCAFSVLISLHVLSFFEILFFITSNTN